MPNGELTSEQLRFLGASIAPYGADGCADITTRANMQARAPVVVMVLLPSTALGFEPGYLLS